MYSLCNALNTSFFEGNWLFLTSSPLVFHLFGFFSFSVLHSPEVHSRLVVRLVCNKCFKLFQDEDRCMLLLRPTAHPSEAKSNPGPIKTTLN